MQDGCVLGFIHDIEIDTERGTLESIIILGRQRVFGFLGREEDIVIPWSEIAVIGDETVLVNCDSEKFNCKKGR